jgi:hypothetical protein
VLGTNRREYDKLFVAPAVGSNFYDGIMAGLLLHDLTIPGEPVSVCAGAHVCVQFQIVCG